jgi:hypothetical protein
MTLQQRALEVALWAVKRELWSEETARKWLQKACSDEKEVEWWESQAVYFEERRTWSVGKLRIH